MKHKHHIVPKHAGGTDDPSNLVELTVEEHAEEHRKLYEKYGRLEDKLAWLGLEGRIGKEEIIRQLLSRPHSEETKKKMSIAAKGKPKSESHKKAMRKPHIISEKGLQVLRDTVPSFKGKKHSKEAIEKNRKAALNRPRVECPHCHKVVDKSNAGRYHFDKCKVLK